jgi:aminobutyraldehyde dehydrogenase
MQTKMLIGGAFVAGEGHIEDVLNPATGETIVALGEASKAQIDAAVAAAAAAFSAWSRTTPAARPLHAGERDAARRHEAVRLRQGHVALRS